MRGLLRRLAYLHRAHGGRLDGREAVAWENGYYTWDRTDLPYPAPPAG